jgi:hypothetical protein
VLFACGAIIILLPFYLLVRANAAWTPHPRFFPDDAVYARMCFPDGFLVYWNDFGSYRLLAVPTYALSNRLVMRASLSPVPYTLIALACATVAFVCSCVFAGLSRRRGVLLAGVLLSSPLLLETLNFWSGTFNYALVLLLCAAQLQAGAWARRATGAASSKVAGEAREHVAGAARRGWLVTACGALLALLTYEIALPFILATGALYARGWWRRLATVGVACVACLALVVALVAAGLYWPQRFKLAAERLTAAMSATTANTATNAAENNSANTASSTTVNNSPNATPNATAGTAASATTNTASNAPAGASTTEQAGVAADVGQLPLVAPHASSARERARMYASLSFSFVRTGLRSPWVWALALALAGMIFLSRPPADAGRLPSSVLASAFAFAFVACVGYLTLTKFMNARYAAFLLIYGAATLAWTNGRVACCALASLLLVQAAVGASLPVHLRHVELAAKGATPVVVPPGRAGDLISVNGRLARASWGKRFLAPPAVDLLARPLGPNACRYSVPCEKCE